MAALTLTLPLPLLFPLVVVFTATVIPSLKKHEGAVIGSVAWICSESAVNPAEVGLLVMATSETLLFGQVGKRGSVTLKQNPTGKTH